MQGETPQVFTELAMCLTDNPILFGVTVTPLADIDALPRAIKFGQRIHGRWINGLFYFPMSTSEVDVVTMIGESNSFGPIIEEPATA